jgi:hypothetical protein
MISLLALSSTALAQVINPVEPALPGSVEYWLTSNDCTWVLISDPFTRVIELDAWNIRERDDRGQSAQGRAAGQKPQRWH